MSESIFLCFLIVLLTFVISIEAENIIGSRLVKIVSKNIFGENDKPLCLVPGNEIRFRPRLSDCNGNYTVWEVPRDGVPGIFKIYKPAAEFLDYTCIRFDIDDISNKKKGTILLDVCDNNSIMYHKNNKVMSVYGDNLCIGKLDPNDTYYKLNLNGCDNKDDKYISWEIVDRDKPITIKKATTKKTTTTTKKTTTTTKKTTTTTKKTTTTTKKTTTTIKKTTTKNTKQTSTDGRCGKDYGGTICPNNECCSKYGHCGTSNDHCGVNKGCQAEFGKCGNRDKDRCGPEFGRCSDGKCCSKYGYCNKTDAHCLIKNGCQNKYGLCKDK